MYSSEDLELFRLVMSKASLLELCHGEKNYEIFSINERNESWLSNFLVQLIFCKTIQYILKTYMCNYL